MKRRLTDYLMLCSMPYTTEMAQFELHIVQNRLVTHTQKDKENTIYITKNYNSNTFLPQKLSTIRTRNLLKDTPASHR